MTVGISICSLCEHHDIDDEGEAVCTAFPGGIPAEIAHQGYDHRNEFEGDNGITFVPRKGVTPERVEAVLALRAGASIGPPADTEVEIA